MEFVFAIIIGTLVLGTPVVALVLATIALAKSRRIRQLEQRIELLENRFREGVPETPFPPGVLPGSKPGPDATDDSERQPLAVSGTKTAHGDVAHDDVAHDDVAHDDVVVADVVVAEVLAVPQQESGQDRSLEMLIGQKGFGWLAVVLAIFSAAFFLKYAYDNNWVGPLGRVGIGILTGCSLMIAGWRYHTRGWRLASQMLSACGVVVLYLSTYSAFGFYHLLPLGQAGTFLTAIIALSMLVAVFYDSPAIGFTAVIGGLITPLLLETEQDAYISLFTYLAALNLGVALLVLRRGWPAMGSVALVGTQILFWMWYDTSYHPEKFAWTLGFQAILFGLYLALDLLGQFRRSVGNRWESSIRMMANAIFWFSAFYVLLVHDYRAWMGTAAMVMAAGYALIARGLLASHGRQTTELLTAIALSVGFITLAIPLEAEACWVALGWAACASLLMWFGVRVQAAPLRGLAAIIAIASLSRLLFHDMQSYADGIDILVWNEIALPGIGISVCLLAAVVAVRRRQSTLISAEATLIGLFGLVVLCVLWLVLTVDLNHFFYMLRRTADGGTTDWRRIGQMSLSVLWTLYASALLAVGFKWSLRPVRWLAIGFFGLTVGKVFLFDMAGLSEIYRIVAFIVLAVVLGVAARVYQRIGSRIDSNRTEETNAHVRS